jgi:hypothetical protein
MLWRCLNNYLSSLPAVHSFLARALAQVIVVTGRQPTGKVINEINRQFYTIVKSFL